MTYVSTAHGEAKYEWVDETDRYVEDDHAINIWHAKVDGDWRGHGEGKALIGQVVDIARREHAEYVAVNMGGGEAAKGMLESLGFTVTSCDADPTKPLEDRHVDAHRDIHPEEWNGWKLEADGYPDDWTGYDGLTLQG